MHTLSLTLAVDWGRWSMLCPSHFTPRKDTWYPLNMRPGGPQGQSGWLQKILPPLEFDPQTIQPTMSHHTDYIVLAYFLIA